MYQVASSKAEEFIHDGEIVETLAYARENRANRPLIEAILQKAAEGKGVTHREAAVLLECELEDLNQRMFTLVDFGIQNGVKTFLADVAADNASSCGVMCSLGFAPSENGTFRRSGTKTEYKNLTFRKDL